MFDGLKWESNEDGKLWRVKAPKWNIALFLKIRYEDPQEVGAIATLAYLRDDPWGYDEESAIWEEWVESRDIHSALAQAYARCLKCMHHLLNEIEDMAIEGIVEHSGWSSEAIKTNETTVLHT